MMAGIVPAIGSDPGGTASIWTANKMTAPKAAIATATVAANIRTRNEPDSSVLRSGPAAFGLVEFWSFPSIMALSRRQVSEALRGLREG
jgi:hypothetical protein